MLPIPFDIVVWIQSAIPAVNSTQIVTAFYSSVSVLLALAGGAVLAWWMPPVREEKSLAK